ncbi:MAG: helix-turn-helix transcriptional regulator, partial [Patescibacteria group bacterium]|nr:helix-turn-helix transcriptional regulator [Patescibacteria group bacterium]
TGKTFVEYLTELRVRKAKEQLAGTDLAVAKIATTVGFATASYFGQIFRSATGLSPGQYRTRHSGKRARSRR